MYVLAISVSVRGYNDIFLNDVLFICVQLRVRYVALLQGEPVTGAFRVPCPSLCRSLLLMLADQMERLLPH
jgi:hypothetical protein